ncbi:organic hydroperoxide resistance protein [Novosphingobium gossypii]|uniref:organic hydroperoxide resistance protein n=1 Tax=Novosphingobium gossypii TaxID=1604774 RepID=UPI003D2572B1
MSIDVKYRTAATANGGRDGRTCTEDGKLDLQLSKPKELGGPGGEGTNPEQLFASGYAACFLSALKFAAHQLKIHLPTGTAVTSTVGIGTRSEGGFGLEVELAVTLPGMDTNESQRLVEAAHQTCPYSNATRGNIDVRLSVI